MIIFLFRVFPCQNQNVPGFVPSRELERSLNYAQITTLYSDRYADSRRSGHMASSSPAGKRQINWQTRNPPGTEQRTKQKLDPTGKRMVTFGQWEKRELPGPFVYMNLDGTAFPLGFGNTFLKEKGLKLAQNPEAKTRKRRRHRRHRHYRKYHQHHHHHQHY